MSVRLTLFGFAVAWVTEARAALLAALDGGIALFTGARVRASIRPKEVRIVRAERIAVPSTAAPSMVLLFRTPVSVRSGKTLVTDGGRLLKSLINRVDGLARWQDLRIEEDIPALERRIEVLVQRGVRGRTESRPVLRSGAADGVRAGLIDHPIQDGDTDGDFGLLA
ncbi:MAG TPA: hypothetical protein VD995_20045, partial [Azospirillum sp.]|nr:hypothetical protein [Azospirillum sp.]